MALVYAKIDNEKKTLTLVMELDEPHASASGKTLVVASTKGNVDSGITMNQRTIQVGVNAYYKP